MNDLNHGIEQAQLNRIDMVKDAVTGTLQGGDRMNHDYAHCLDYSPDCPKECFRARLTKDLKGRIDLGGIPLTWMHRQ